MVGLVRYFPSHTSDKRVAHLKCGCRDQLHFHVGKRRKVVL